MKDIAIYGAGGFGREVACLIHRINKQTDEPIYNLIGFFDDGRIKGEATEYGPILGNIDDVNNWPTPLAIAIAIGSPKALSVVSSKITNPLVEFPNIIAPDFWVADETTIHLGKGNIIQGACVLSCNVSLGDFNVLNGYVVFGHDASCGNCNVIMPGVRVSGDVRISQENLIGAMSFILQGIKIGTGVTLSPGSILLTKPKDNNTYIGNPAKIFRY